ncbi:T9SS type A sorting domain-containing protein [Mesonia maritima]|uniref:Secretion system C-terminal sorting domain-containing protein n=1 Tax=Mesonia maritima TaxID=1793873 RepID=A0ABU1K908_9FLAO|nr:T9SS type A sorting domain-containing protein [Mesonia maritima]MDR6302093.1 hypothetical protein [Mesonia maritima]
MKKITFLAIAMIFSIATQAQDTSFESSEGYTLGEIDGQSTWVVNPDYSYFVTVSDEQASEGAYALKLGLDDQSAIPDGNIAGPTYDVSGSIDSNADSMEFAVDIYAADATVGEIDYFINDSQGNTTTRVAIFNGEINIIAPSGGQLAIVASTSIANQTFANLKINLNFVDNEIIYYVDDTVLYTGTFWGGTSVGSLGFLTAGDSEYFVDNITYSDMLSTKDFETVSFSHYTQNNQLVMNSDSQIGNVAIFNILGQQVISENVNSTSGNIDLNALSSGVYLTKVSVNNETKSFKFVKK